jgi:hypothetical protein
MILDNVHLPFDEWLIKHPVSHDNCFLCGVSLTAQNKTDEHILPQWIQRDCDLWNQPLTLPNGTTIPYAQLRIPCCSVCNNGPLSRMETEVAAAARGGFNCFVATLSPLRVFQWLQCVAYKLLFKELRLKEDRREKDSPSIMTPEDLSRLRLPHLFLRSIDKNVVFKDFFPASIYALQVKTSPDRAKNFDYVDAIPEQCIAVRIGEIGLIGVLNDGELLRIAQPRFLAGIDDKVLNPAQFKNAFAKCLYTKRLFNDPFTYGVSFPGTCDAEIKQVLRNSQPKAMVFSEWNPVDYAATLAAVLKCRPEGVMLPDGSVGSLFYDMEGNWKDRPFDDTGVKS